MPTPVARPQSIKPHDKKVYHKLYSNAIQKLVKNLLFFYEMCKTRAFGAKIKVDNGHAILYNTTLRILVKSVCFITSGSAGVEITYFDRRIAK